MKRLAAHRIFIGRDSYLCNVVVEFDDRFCFQQLFSLVERNVEPANTLFLDEDIFLMKSGENPSEASPFLPTIGEKIDIYLRKENSGEIRFIIYQS